jgi:uncharacterized cupredoxin-like copper-binding protein
MAGAKVSNAHGMREPTGEQRGMTDTGGLLVGLALGVFVLALTFAGVVAMNHGDQGSASPLATPVTLTDYNISLPGTTLSPGSVTLQIANAAGQQHELLVFATDLAPASFPKSPDGSVDEEGPEITKVSDGDNINPGGTQTRTVDLTKPGNYVLICNLPGHYAQGMYTTITVR